MTRREWCALSGLLVAPSCGRTKATGYAGSALIATAGSESVAVVDLNEFRLAGSVPVGGQPTAVLAGGPGGASYVLTPANGSVYMLDGGFKVKAQRKLADELSEIRLTSDGKSVLAIAPKRQELIEVDAATLAVKGRHKLSAPPAGLDVTEGYAAVSTGEHGTVELLNLETGQVRRAQISRSVGAVRFRADGRLLLVANREAQSLTALASPTLDLVADLALAMQPDSLCFNANQGQLFVSGAGMDGVAIVFPYDTLEVEQTVLAGRDPGAMTCSAEPAYLFVGSHSGSDVCILDVDSRKLMGIVDVGQRPTYLTTTPDSQYALVLNERAGDLAVIHIPAIKWNRARSGASLFTMLAVGQRPVHAAIVPRSG